MEIKKKIRKSRYSKLNKLFYREFTEWQFDPNIQL